MSAIGQEEPIKSAGTKTADPAASGGTSGATETKASQSLVEAALARAAQFMEERRFVEARKALEEAERLEAGPLKDRAKRLAGSVRSRVTDWVSPMASPASEGAALAPVEKSMSIVKQYSKIAAAVGLLPGGLLNFAGDLAVQGTMVWKIANTFGHREGKERIRGSILAMIGSIVPMGIGQGAGIAIASIPAVIAGTVVYFVATPILAYAMTKSIGNAFIMHFESGGTLLTFDPKAFADHFVKEFKKAGGTVSSTPDGAPAAEAASGHETGTAPVAA